jgi:hypothetical protein
MAILLSLAFPVFSQGATLSGTVFVDINSDGKVDTTDWGVRSDPIQLFDLNGQLLKEVLTNEFGQYFFGDLAAGTYTVKNTIPCYLGNVAYVGQTLNASNVLQPSNGTPNSSLVQISNIVLNLDYKGINYNFGNDEYPMKLYSKIMLIADNDYQVQTVPEPATIVGLLTMALTGCGWAFFRRRRQ